MDSTSPNSGCVLESAELRRMTGDEALNVLKCGICWEFYVEPTVLACGHTFCSRCLTSMAQHAKQNNCRWPAQNIFIGCPNCRRPVLASVILSHKMPHNYPLASLLESLRQRQRPKMVDQETNTDVPESEKESKCSDDNEEIRRKRKTQYDYDVEQLDLITDDLGVILRTLAANGTILGDMSCVKDIQQIARDFHNSSPSCSDSDEGNDGNDEDNGGYNSRAANQNGSADQSTNTDPPTQPQHLQPNGARQSPGTAARHPTPVTKQPPSSTSASVGSQSFQDPAIVSYSIGTGEEPDSARALGQIWVPNEPIELFAFPGFFRSVRQR